MKTACLVIAMLVAGGASAMAQSLDDVRLTEGRLEHRSNLFFGYSAVQHFKVENLTDRSLRVGVECGFETATGYADGSGDAVTILARQSVEGAIGGNSATGKKIERAGCTVASVSLR